MSRTLPLCQESYLCVQAQLLQQSQIVEDPDSRHHHLILVQAEVVKVQLRQTPLTGFRDPLCLEHERC